jgi:hypothetical protein
MQGSPYPTPPSWNEAASFRETTLIWIDDPEDRDALRRVGRLLYDLAVEVSQAMAGEPSMTRAELRAAGADRRSWGILARLSPTLRHGPPPAR